MDRIDGQRIYYQEYDKERRQIDLRGAEPKYIMPRVNVYHGDVDKSAAGLNVNLLDYYQGIPNRDKNGFTPNPSQQ